MTGGLGGPARSPHLSYQTYLVRFPLTFLCAFSIIVQRGINATVSSRSLAGYRFFFSSRRLAVLPTAVTWRFAPGNQDV